MSGEASAARPARPERLSVSSPAAKLAAVIGVPLDVARSVYRDERALDAVLAALELGGPTGRLWARHAAEGRAGADLLAALRHAAGRS